MRTFETALAKLTPYIVKVAGDNAKRSPMFGFDDLMQEFRIAIHRCVQKYPNIPDKDFEKVAVVSVKNILFTLFRPAYIREDMKHFRYEAGKKKADVNGVVFGESGLNPGNGAEMDEDQSYDVAIDELLAELGPEDAATVKDLIDPKKKRPMGKKAKQCAELREVLRLSQTA